MRVQIVRDFDRYLICAAQRLLRVACNVQQQSIRCRIVTKSDASLLCYPARDAFVNIVATQHRVPGGRHDFQHPFVEAQN